MSLEEQELIKSQKTGHWGFATPALSAVGQSLLTADVPEWMARAWTVTLCRWRYSTGTLANVGGVVVDPDNQTDATPMTCLLVWGVGGSNERATIDYPRQGVTFQLHAAFLRLYVNTPTTVSPRPPLIAGFVSPSGRSSSYPSQLPTLTNDVTVLPAGTLAWLDVPARAVAYRMYPETDGSVSNNFTVNELAAGGGVLCQDYGSSISQERFTVVDNGSVEHLYTQRSMWIPLDPRCAGLRINNGSGTNVFQAAVQWLIDLG